MFWHKALQLRAFCSQTFKPLRDEDRIFTNLYGRHSWHLHDAMNRGDWHKTNVILKKDPKWILNQIEKSGLRGRGGAGFLVGNKLSMSKSIKNLQSGYIVINGAEGEPGTCKDREILRHEPHKIIEGALLAGRAVCAKAAIVFIRAKFYNEACTLQLAIAEAYEAGFLGANACGSCYDFDVFIQRGGGKYICGEETALINCIMGNYGRPYRKPPYPGEKGVFELPSAVINTETVSVLPTICRRGGSWFSSLGCKPHSTGTKIFSISGHVNKPCTVEEELGVSLRQLIDCHAAGVQGGWDNLLAVMPGGISTSLIPKAICNNLQMDFQSLKNVNSSLGTGGIIVMDKSTNIIRAMERTLLFYRNESCHQCKKCRELSTWAHEYAQRFVVGNAQTQDIDWLWQISEWAEGDTICSFADANAYVVYGFIRHFRTEMEQRMRIYRNM